MRTFFNIGFRASTPGRRTRGVGGSNRPPQVAEGRTNFYSGDDSMETKAILWPSYDGSAQILLHASHSLARQADFAARLMEHLSIISAIPDGEDSAGRQKIALMPPNEVASRACNISAAAFAEFESRGWLVPAPDPIPLRSEEERLAARQVARAN